MKKEDRQSQIAHALAVFLAGDQHLKSIQLELEFDRSCNDPRPRLGIEWSALRQVFQIQGSPTVAEAERQIRDILW